MSEYLEYDAEDITQDKVRQTREIKTNGKPAEEERIDVKMVKYRGPPVMEWLKVEN